MLFKILVVALKKLHQLCIILSLRIDWVHFEIEKVAKFFFQKACCSTNFEPTLWDDSYTISQVLSLIHVMGCKDDDLVFFSLFDDLPSLSARLWVHSRSWFIEQHELWVAEKSNCELKLALLSSGDLGCKSRCSGSQIEFFERFINYSIHVLHILQLTVEDEILSNSHFCEQYFDLWAEPNEVSNVLVVCKQIHLAWLDVIDNCLARGRLS